MQHASYETRRDLGHLLAQANRLAGDGRHAEARLVYLQALEQDECCRARNAFGIFLTRIESFDDAIYHFSRVLEWAQQKNDRELCSVAAHNLAAVYREMGQWSRAAHCQQRAMSAGLEAGSVFDATCCLGTAWDAIRAGELVYARQVLLASWSDFRRQRCIGGQGDAQCGLGIVASREGDYRAAVIYFWKAHRLHRACGRRLDMARDLMNLGQLSLKIGRYRRAHACLKSARNIFSQLGAQRSARRAGVSLTEAWRCRLVMHADPLLN